MKLDYCSRCDEALPECDCVLKERKIAELVDQVAAFKEVIQRQSKTIGVMNHLLMDKGIIFNFSNVDEIWQQLQQATEKHWDRLEARLAATNNTHPPQEDESW